MVTSSKHSFIVDGGNSTDISLTPGETIRFGSPKFTADRFSRLSLSPDEWDSGTFFVGMVHIESLSSHTTLKDSSDEGGTTSSAGGELRIPRPLRVQRGNPDCPHHHHANTGKHFGGPDHLDDHGVDHGTSARHGAPPHPTASLPGGTTSTIPCSVDRRRAVGSPTSRRACQQASSPQCPTDRAASTQGHARDGASHNHRLHQSPSTSQGHRRQQQPRGSFAPNLRQGQSERDCGSSTFGHSASTLHRWGG
jgi:hypothetical protein